MFSHLDGVVVLVPAHRTGPVNGHWHLNVLAHRLLHATKRDTHIQTCTARVPRMPATVVLQKRKNPYDSAYYLLIANRL